MLPLLNFSQVTVNSVEDAAQGYIATLGHVPAVLPSTRSPFLAAQVANARDYIFHDVKTAFVQKALSMTATSNPQVTTHTLTHTHTHSLSLSLSLSCSLLCFQQVPVSSLLPLVALTP